jgi:hypothetical protein
MVFRTQDDANWYKVAVEPQTQRVIVNSLIRGSSTILYNQVVNGVRTGTEGNTLRVVATGASFTVSVNGQELQTIREETFSRGQVGLIANGGAQPAEIRFTRFELTPRS